jgi:poly(hydroxyalkanoate) depolymerase family esterase
MRQRPHRLLSIIRIAVLFLCAINGAHAAEPREDKRFGSNPGNLSMFSYVPEGFPARAALIVVLHGCKQDAVDFARNAGWLALADDMNVALLLPQQKGLPPRFHDAYVPPFVVASWGANNQNGCFNWFEPKDNARDQGEVLSIRQMIDTMISRHALDRSRVFIAGFSAGGAMAAAMLAAYPEMFAGGAIVSGVAYRCAATVSQALRCMNPGIDHSPAEWRRNVAVGAQQFPPVSIWQGSADKRVVPQNQRELVEQWTAVHGIADHPARTESEPSPKLKRSVYTDAAGVIRVESVLVDGLDHAFPIETGGAVSCGQVGDFVIAAGVCAAREIGRFWGLVAR